MLLEHASVLNTETKGYNNMRSTATMRGYYWLRVFVTADAVVTPPNFYIS